MTAAALRALALRLEAEAASVRALADAIDARPVASTGDDLLGRPPGLPLRTWRSAIRSGELQATKVGREYRARRRDIDAWLAAHRVEPGPPVPRHPGLARATGGDEFERTIARAHAKRGAA